MSESSIAAAEQLFLANVKLGDAMAEQKKNATSGQRMVLQIKQLKLQNQNARLHAMVERRKAIKRGDAEAVAAWEKVVWFLGGHQIVRESEP